MLALTSVLGAMNLYEVACPEKVPQVANIGKCEEQRLAREYPDTYVLSDDPEENWRRLQPALKVLRKVCPEAAAWVRRCHDEGRLYWDTRLDEVCATYAIWEGRLSIRSGAMCHNYGDIAAMLGHEFRHSRQHYTKFARIVVCNAVVRTFPEWIMEDEAYDFQRQISEAVFR